MQHSITALLSLLLLCFVSESTTATPGWVSLSSMLFARSDFVAVTVDNHIYILGGCDSNQTTSGFCSSVTDRFTRYSISSDSWEVLKPSPRPRYRYMAAVVNGLIYYIGGRLQNDTVVSQVDVYDISAGNWTTLGNQGGSTDVSDGAAFVIGQKVYVSGGYSLGYEALNSTVVLDTQATTVDAKGVFKKGLVNDKSISAGDNGAVAIGEYGYVFGGWTSGSSCTPLNTVERYDSVSNSWSQLPTLNHARGDMAYATLGQTLFVMGGETKESCNISVPIGNVEYYNTNYSSSWKDLTPIAITRFRFSGAAWGDEIYDLGGQGAVDRDHYPVLKDVYAYNVSDYINNNPTPTPTPTSTSSPTPTPTPSSSTTTTTTPTTTLTPSPGSGSMLTMSIIVVLTLPLLLNFF